MPEIQQNDPLMNAVSNQINDLAATPPGPAAQSKAADVVAFLYAVLTNPAVAKAIPIGWKVWTAALVGVLSLLGTGGFLGRLTAPTPTQETVVIEKPAPAKDSPPVTVNVHPPGAPEVSPIVLPSPLKGKVMLYATGKIDLAAVNLAMKDMPVSVSLESKIYPAGSTYPFGGKSISLPCAALIDSGGKILDVRTFTTPADLAAWVKAAMK